MLVIMPRASLRGIQMSPVPLPQSLHLLLALAITEEPLGLPSSASKGIQLFCFMVGLGNGGCQFADRNYSASPPPTDVSHKSHLE